MNGPQPLASLSPKNIVSFPQAGRDKLFLTEKQGTMQDTRIELASHNRGEEINIFVHGFGRLKRKDLDIYLWQLRDLRLRGRTYLFNWDSGLLWRPLIPMALMAGGLLCYTIYKKIKGGIPPGGAPKKGLLGRLFNLGAPVLPVFPVAAGIEFNRSKARADALGRDFQRIIGGIPGIKEAPVNLIGFSLGARVIHVALLTLSWKAYHLRDICLLGGATDASPADWEVCLGKTCGCLYNFYSKNDDALAVKPDTEKNVGRHPIPLEVPRVVNIETLLHHHRHPCYTDNLKELLQVLGPLTDDAAEA
jgi:hypothetical protein